jgi:hypothetical protein
VPKREVKEEPEYTTPPALLRRRGSSSITIRELARYQERRAGSALLLPKSKLKEDQDEKDAVKAA